MMCAFINGYSIDAVDYEHYKDNKIRAEFNLRVYCHDHSPDQNVIPSYSHQLMSLERSFEAAVLSKIYDKFQECFRI